MKISIDPGAEKLISVLEDNGFSAYITGNAVRDFLMDKPVSSVQISTSASPSQIAQIFAGSVVTKNNTCTVAENNMYYEISAFSSAEAFSARTPDLYDDLSAKPFTIDAVAFSPREGILDFFGGLNDIKARVVKCLSSPDESFSLHPENMLRAVWFCAALGFTINNDTEKAIRKYSIYAKQIPHGILLEELNKLLMSPAPDFGFFMLRELGLLQYIIPRLDTCFSVPQKNKYHIYNVGEHILCAVKNTPSDLVLRWSALLHDIGKPLCFSRDSNDIIHFYGHHRESMKIAEDILSDFRFPQNAMREIIQLIEYHDVRIDPSLHSVKKLLSKLGYPLFCKLLILQEADCRAKNPIYIDEKLEKTRTVKKLLKIIIEEGQPYKTSDLAINARDLMKLKYRAGRQISDTLKTLLDDVILNPSLNNREYLLSRAKNLKKKQ